MVRQRRRGWSMMGTLIVCLVILIGCAGAKPVPPAGLDFLHEHRQTLELGDDGAAFAPTLLDGAAQQAAVILLGEAHGVAINEALDFALFTYFYETAGVRTYIAETGYGMGALLNRYVQSGDDDQLRNLFAALEGTTAWNRERFVFWHRLHAWNQTLPADARVRVVGLDVEHQYPVGVGYVLSLLPDAAPASPALAEPVETLRAMVDERRWDAHACHAAVEALLAAIETYPDVADAYFGVEVGEVQRALQALATRFVYYATEDANAADAARDRYMVETYLALGLQTETVYGKWGAEHVYQHPYRGLERFAMLLDGAGSPVAGRVLSIDLVYADSRQLRIRNGSYGDAAVAAPRRIVRPLRRMATGDVTLFQLTGATSPFAEGLYLLRQPTGGGVTTDYVQAVMLVGGAEAAAPLQ